MPSIGYIPDSLRLHLPDVNDELIVYPEPSHYFVGPDRHKYSELWYAHLFQSSQLGLELGISAAEKDVKHTNEFMYFIEKNELPFDSVDWIAYCRAHPVQLKPDVEDLSWTSAPTSRLEENFTIPQSAEGRHWEDERGVCNHASAFKANAKIATSTSPKFLQESIGSDFFDGIEYARLENFTDSRISNDGQHSLIPFVASLNDQFQIHNSASTSTDPHLASIHNQTTKLNIHKNHGSLSLPYSSQGYQDDHAIPHILTSPFPEFSHPDIPSDHLTACLDHYLPPGKPIGDLPEMAIAHIKALAGPSISIRNIIRDRYHISDPKDLERLCNRVSMRDQRFRDTHGILMGSFKLWRSERGRTVPERKNCAKLKALSEAQLLHQTWGTIDFEKWTTTCGETVFPLERPRALPVRIEHALRECGLPVPDLDDYLRRFPCVAEHFSR